MIGVGVTSGQPPKALYIILERTKTFVLGFVFVLAYEQAITARLVEKGFYLVLRIHGLQDACVIWGTSILPSRHWRCLGHRLQLVGGGLPRFPELEGLPALRLLAMEELLSGPARSASGVAHVVLGPGSHVGQRGRRNLESKVKMLKRNDY